MRFTLFDDASAGTQKWQETHSGGDAVQVTNGCYSVELGSLTSFPANLFQDNANLWLEVEIDLDGDGFETSEKYSPRVPFSAAPYAFQSDNADTLDVLDSTSFLRSDADDVCTGRIEFKGVPTGFAPTQASVQIHPASSNPTDSILSVWTSGSDMVIMGGSGDLTASGVFQAGTIYTPQAYNRLGDGTPSQAAIDASNDLLINGALEVKDGVYWGARTSYYSVLAVDCVPGNEGYQFTRDSDDLYKDIGVATSQKWYAPVHLPHGATVTSITGWFYDISAYDLTCSLYRRVVGGGGINEMASIDSSGVSGETCVTDSFIQYPNIDNSSSTYYVYVRFSSVDTGPALKFRNASITYTTTEP